MSDKDIIRIEGCIKGEKVLCLSCPYRDKYPECRKYVIRDIFDVAKRQKAEIERLQSAVESLVNELEDDSDEYD